MIYCLLFVYLQVKKGRKSTIEFTYIDTMDYTI